MTAKQHAEHEGETMAVWLHFQAPEMREWQCIFDYISKRGRVGGGNGIKFIIHTSENGHNKPHLHAQYQQKEVVLEIPSGKVITGNINSKKMKLASEWVVTNEAFLKKNGTSLLTGFIIFADADLNHWSVIIGL